VEAILAEVISRRAWLDLLLKPRGYGSGSMVQENVGQFVVEKKRRLRFRNPQRIREQLRGTKLARLHSAKKGGIVQPAGFAYYLHHR
jgi:hypothetical protein